MDRELFTRKGLLAAMTPADRVLSIALVVAALLAPRLVPANDELQRAVVTVGRREAAQIPLTKDGETVVRGRIGDVVVRVEDGAVRIAEATCPERVCIAAGAKRRTGEVIACVPNQLLVRITGGPADPDVPDAVTR